MKNQVKTQPTSSNTSPRTGKIYTPRSLSAELQVSARAVLRAIHRNELRCAKISSLIFRIEGSDVDAWLDGLKNQ